MIPYQVDVILFKESAERLEEGVGYFCRKRNVRLVYNAINKADTFEQIIDHIEGDGLYVMVVKND